MEKDSIISRLKPFLVTLVVLVSDQLSKLWVVRNIPENTLYSKHFGDFLWIIHVRNTGAAFSFGAGFSDALRIVVFIVLPLLAMLALAVSVFVSDRLYTGLQRYLMCGIIGGGLGTVADRIFRFSEGVVDFISVKFYGILGMDRWPTFNISDSCVVVFVILFALSVLLTKEKADA